MFSAQVHSIHSVHSRPCPSTRSVSVHPGPPAVNSTPPTVAWLWNFQTALPGMDILADRLFPRDLPASSRFEQDALSRCLSFDLKTSRLVCLFFIPLGLCMAGCSPRTGPDTAQQMQSLTNAVQRLTSDPIMKVEQLDVGVLLVSTDSVPSGRKQNFCMQRMRRGWTLVPSSTTP